MDFNWLCHKIQTGEYIISAHAERERLAENIDVVDIEEGIISGRILEDYTTDPRGASCLVLGYSKGKAIHIVCGQKQDKAVIVTVYLPQPPHWITPDQRGKRG